MFILMLSIFLIFYGYLNICRVLNQGAISLGFSSGMKNRNHCSSDRGGVSKTYRFFFTCRLVFWPIKLQTNAGEGMDRIICKCLAPLCRQPTLLAGNGIFIKDPLSKGLEETILILRASAVSNNDPYSWFFSAKLSGIIRLIYVQLLITGICRNWKPLSAPPTF